MAKLRAVYYINQFYAGMGGEEMADTGLHILEEKKGPALGMEPMWKGEMEIVKVLVCGDNFINTNVPIVTTNKIPTILAKRCSINRYNTSPAFFITK